MRKPVDKYRHEHQPKQRQIVCLAKQLKALALRQEGMAYDDIAKEVGYNSYQACHKAVMTALHNTLAEPANELRTLEAQRLDKMMQSVWKRCIGYAKPDGTIFPPQPELIDSVLKIMARRAKMLGLDAPEKHDHTSDGKALKGYAPSILPSLWRGEETVAATPVTINVDLAKES